MFTYDVKLRDIINGNKFDFFMRKIEIKVNSDKIESNIKIPRYHYAINVPLNEAYISLTYDKIKLIISHNNERDKFVRYFNSKIKRNKFNIPFVTITVSKDLSDEDLRNIVYFMNDFIYGNPYVEFIVPPKIIVENPKHSHYSKQLFIKILDNIIEELETLYRKLKLIYFIPDYFTHNELIKVINKYAENYGPSGIYVIDMDNKRYSSQYPRIGIIMRIMRLDYDEEHYAIYLFNHRSSKRSGTRVPSEDMLAFLNGVNYIGPAHQNIPVPPQIAPTLNKTPKIINENDFMYYHLKEAPNINEYERFKYSLSIKNDRIASSSFNDTITNTLLRKYQDSHSIEKKLSNTRMQDFARILSSTSRKVANLIRMRTINSLLGE